MVSSWCCQHCRQTQLLSQNPLNQSFTVFGISQRQTHRKLASLPWIFFFRGLNAGDVFFPLLCSGPRHVGSGKLGLLAYSPELFLDESVFKPSVECGVKVVYCLLRGFQQSRIAKVWCYCLQKWVTPFPQDGNWFTGLWVFTGFVKLCECLSQGVNHRQLGTTWAYSLHNDNICKH